MAQKNLPPKKGGKRQKQPNMAQFLKKSPIFRKENSSQEIKSNSSNQSDASIKRFGYTQTPNAINRHWMSKISGNAYKVLNVVCDKTIGWHKESEVISKKDFMEMSGLGEKAITRALKDLKNKGLIIAVNEESGYAIEYKLNIEVANVSNKKSLGSPSEMSPPSDSPHSPLCGGGGYPTHSSPGAIYQYRILKRKEEKEKTTSSLKEQDGGEKKPQEGGERSSILLSAIEEGIEEEEMEGEEEGKDEEEEGEVQEENLDAHEVIDDEGEWNEEEMKKVLALVQSQENPKAQEKAPEKAQEKVQEKPKKLDEPQRQSAVTFGYSSKNDPKAPRIAQNIPAWSKGADEEKTPRNALDLTHEQKEKMAALDAIDVKLETKLKLLKFGLEKIKTGIANTLRKNNVMSLDGYLYDQVSKAYEKRLTKEERVAIDKKWAYDDLRKYDGRECNGYEFEVLSTGVMWSAWAPGGGVYKHFAYGEPKFKDLVLSYASYIANLKHR